MKLKTKLIPLTGLGLATLAIAPISLTSCSKKIIGKAFDLVKNYYPSFTKHEYAELTQHDVHDLYREEITNRPETFVEDYFWSKSWRGTSFDQYFFWDKLILDPTDPNAIRSRFCFGPAKVNYEYDREVISNLEISTQSVRIQHGDEWVPWIYPTLSFTLEFDSKINQIILDKYYGQDDISGYLNGTANGKITFNNVPFHIKNERFESTNNKGEFIYFDAICFEPDTEWMFQRTTPLYEPTQPADWKIYTEVKSTISGEVKYSSGIQERVADDWTLAIEANSAHPEWQYENISLEQTIAKGFTSSYYLNNVKLIAEEEK